MWKRMTLLLILGALAPLVWVSLALAQNGYDLSWWTVDGGGLISTQGGGYVLGGTVGQPDADASMSGGDYTLAGGFWGVGSAGGSGGDIYLPIAVK